MPAASAIVISRAVAVKYYTQVPVEPIPGGGSVEVKKASVLPKPTMITLLQFVARTKPRNLVIVAHGEGGGITVRLAPSSESALVSPHLGALVSSSGKVTADLAKELGISMANLKALQEAAAKVRALKLGRVDFRACTLGEFADSLELLRAFFGAGAVSAPKKLDEFGGVSPG
ncbi:MAG: hypothetical protein QM286_10735, partial [Acidobacteriota bacterium]|nr:hypothetical protein [Acidobacteriota bacterium]